MDSIEVSLQWKGKHKGIATCCRFSNDGQYIVTGSDLFNEIKMWDVSSGECTKALSGECFFCDTGLSIKYTSSCNFEKKVAWFGFFFMDQHLFPDRRTYQHHHQLHVQSER